MSHFIFYSDLLGEYDNFDNWGSAEEREIEKKRQTWHKDLTDLAKASKPSTSEINWVEKRSKYFIYKTVLSFSL